MVAGHSDKILIWQKEAYRLEKIKNHFFTVGWQTIYFTHSLAGKKYYQKSKIVRKIKTNTTKYKN